MLKLAVQWGSQIVHRHKTVTINQRFMSLIQPSKWYMLIKKEIRALREYKIVDLDHQWSRFKHLVKSKH